MVTAAVPAAASPDSYMTYLVATTYAPHKPGAPTLGAAAADKLTFNIPARSPFPLALTLAGMLVLVLLLSIVRWYRGATPTAPAVDTQT